MPLPDRAGPSFVLWLAATGAALGAQSPATEPSADAAATALDRRLARQLTGRHETARVRVHYDPDAIDERRRDAAVADIEANLADLEELFAQRFDGRVLAFLYADVADLRRRTGAAGGTVAFSTGTHSLHQAHDFRGPHELTHLLALQFPRDEDSYEDLFVVEGLATALARVDRDVDVHDWATVYLRVGRMPDLLALRATFPEGAPQGVHPYHVAGSFVGWLIERFGIEKVKGYYVNATEAQHWFGAPARRLERQWLAWLGAREVAPANRRVVLQALGIEHPLPLALRDAPGEDLLAARSLVGFDAEHAAAWTFDGGTLRGEHDGPWTHLRTRAAAGERVALRARLRLVAGNALKLASNCGERQNEAIFATWATYLSAGEGYVGGDSLKLATGVWHDVVLVHERGELSLFVDGARVLHSPSAPSNAAGAVGIAVEKGVVEFAKLERIDDW